MDRRKFVLFELNEVPLRVVRRFAHRHPTSAFAKILASGRSWEAVTPDEGHLSPWITWPTLHRGVPGKKHGLMALGQDHDEVDREYPPVWTQLAAAGRRVGMFGSLHSYPLPKNVDHYAFYLPDTFAAGPEAAPRELSVFQSFNLQMVDRSGRNVSNEVPVKDAIAFLLRSIPAGLRPATLAKVARQVATERIWLHRTARRRTIQSVLAFDLFLSQLRAKTPDAAFFFTNHVASSMHRYWPATFADDYQVAQWSDDWVRRFAGEIDYTMSEADQMLAELMAFADRHPDYLILVSGSMGQAAVDDPSRQVKTAVLLRDSARFVDQLGLKGQWKRQRTMEPTYTFAFGEESDAECFSSALATVKIAGKFIECRKLNKFAVEFTLGQTNISDEQLTITIGNQAITPADFGIANVTIDDEAGAAAYHIPEGMLLAYDPRVRGGGNSERATISTTQIAPTLLALQRIEAPPYMERPIEILLSSEMERA